MIPGMNKIVLAFYLVSSLAVGELSKSMKSNSLTPTDNYIHLSKLQHEKVIQYFDDRIKHFGEHYKGRLDVIYLQLEMVTESIVEINDRLSPFEVLEENITRCITKYRVMVPRIVETTTAISACAIAASKQLDPCLSIPIRTRNRLAAYYANQYGKSLEECAIHNEQTTKNYTLCVTSVTGEANAYTTAQRKLFETQLETAECSAKSHIKVALDCSFSIGRHTISSISEANIQINRCVDGREECEPCKAYTCSQSFNLQADYESATIRNPFQGRYNETCLMLNVN